MTKSQKRGRLQANTLPNLKGVLAGNRFLTDDRHFPAQYRPNRAAPDEMTRRWSIRAAYRANLERFMWHFYG
jgi:hypothetical protein